MDKQDTTPGGGDHQQVAEAVRSEIAARGLSQADVARQSDMSGATLSAFLSGTYKGNNDEIARKLAAWCATVAAGDVLSATLDRLNGVIETPSCKAILDTLHLVKLLGGVATVCGRPGSGKTTAAKRLARQVPAVWYVEFGKDTVSPYYVLKEIGEAVGITEPPLRPDELRREIVKRIAGRRGLIICDEAHHLSPAGLETIRTLHDRTGVGVALCGHLDLRDHIARLPQLDGRVLAPLVIAAKPADVDALLAAWGCDCKRTRDFLRERVKLPADLRRVAKAYQLAAMHAGAEGVETTFDHVRKAWGELDGSSFVE